MFEGFSGEPLSGTRKRLAAALAGAGVFYVVLGVAGAAIFARYGVEAIEEEKEVEVKFVASSPPPPPPPPTTPPVNTAPPPPPPPKSRPPKPNEVLPPPKPIEAPKDIPQDAPKEADPSQETGPPPSPEGAGEGEGDPFGQRGGKAEGTPGGKPGGVGSGPASEPAAEKPVVLPPGATAPEPVDPNAKPDYPRAALEARFEGEVVVKVIVHADGHVEVVKIMKSDPNFDAAVLDFLKTYRMKPAVYGGRPIAVYRNLRFPFRLN